MTNKEFKDYISKANEPEWFNDFEIKINYPQINFSQNFKGITSFYEFILQQIKGWEKINDELPLELMEAKNYFTTLKQNVLNFVNQIISHNAGQRTNHWNRNVNLFSSNSQRVFLYNSPEIEFLINIYNFKKEYYFGAYHFIIGEIHHMQSDKNNFIGSMMAYEFYTKDISQLVERKNAEKSSLAKLRSDFQIYLSDSSSQLTEHLTSANQEYKNYVESLEQLKTEKNESFQEWFDNSKKTNLEFDENSNKKMNALESLYGEKLMLQAPAKYWDERAKGLRSVANKWLCGLIISTVIGVGLLFSLLTIIANGTFEELFTKSGSTIRWSIVFVTFITFIAFLIRTFTKLTFSTFHLVRDAEERKQLSYVYLALKENGSIADTERHIVLQSIFSRADTGLLKEDSSPTMPSSILDKVSNSGR